jgi:hypothetical protein
MMISSVKCFRLGDEVWSESSADVAKAAGFTKKGCP